MEFKRRGKFKRVFPSVDYHYYRQFFTEERPLNIILDQKLMSKRRLTAGTTVMVLNQGNSLTSNTGGGNVVMTMK